MWLGVVDLGDESAKQGSVTNLIETGLRRDPPSGQHDRILVTRNGRPSFVLVSPDDLTALEETLDVLQTTS
jgi:Antitoxin Phd_YefM, type II toxin-antitoxin system